MDKVIATTLLIVASVVSAVLVINAVYPALARSGNSLINVTNQINTRIESQVRIVYATGELDEDGNWQDSNGNSLFDVHVWAKNVGSVAIADIEQADIFFGAPGTFRRIPHEGDAGGTYPSWTYAIENGTSWSRSVTVRFSIQYETAPASGEYYVKLVTPSGVYDDRAFSF